MHIEPEAHGSTISINLENPDFICVTIRKTSKISVTDENERLKLRIPLDETVAENVAEKLLKIQLPEEDSSSEESFGQFLESWPSEETDELSETEFDVEVLRSKSSELECSAESLGAASDVCKVLRTKGWRKGQPEVNLPFRPGRVEGLQQPPKRSAAGGCKDQRGSFNLPAKPRKLPTSQCKRASASLEPQRFRHFFDFDLDDNLQTESFLQSNCQEFIKNSPRRSCSPPPVQLPRPPPTFSCRPPFSHPPLLKPLCHRTPSTNTYKIFQRNPCKTPKKHPTKTKISLVDKLSTTCQIDPKESIHSNFSEVELSNLSYCIAPKKEKGVDVQSSFCYRSEVCSEIRQKSNMSPGHAKKGNITFDKRLERECRKSDDCCKKNCKDWMEKGSCDGRNCCQEKRKYTSSKVGFRES